MNLLARISKLLERMFRGKFMRDVTVRFRGWKSHEIKQRFNGGFHYYMEELAARRVEPWFPPGVFFIDGLANEIEGVGIPPNTDIKIYYDLRWISIPEIMRYLETIGLDVELLPTSAEDRQ